MGASPPLTELSARKRLVQARMEIHRAEMALYFDQMVSPFQRISSRVQAVVGNPIVRVGVVGGLGFLLVSGKLKFLRKVTSWAAPLILPRIRNFVMNRLASMVARKS